jgi:hypothetical protein
VAGSLIQAATPRACFVSFQHQVSDYWGRLAQEGSGRGVIAVTPAVRFDPASSTIELGLGDAFVRGHQPMATSDEAQALCDRGRNDGVVLDTLDAPLALVLGIQWLRVEQDPASKTFFLRTYQYKYCLIVRSALPSAAAPTWFALRLESDSEIGQNSWLLNHPVHHLQLGLCDDLRIPSSRGRSLIAFVDSAIRAFAPEVWAELYPSLYLELNEPAGRFAGFTKEAIPEREKHLRAPHAADLRELLREGRAQKHDWHLDLERWREDIGDHSECAPELFDLFLPET